MQAIDRLPDRLRQSIGATMMKDALGSMDNRALAEFMESMSINNGPHFTLSAHHQDMVNDWMKQQTEAPDEGPGSVQGKHVSRRGFMKTATRYGVGFLTAVSALNGITGIPRGDEPEEQRRDALRTAGGAAVIGASEVVYHRMDRAEQRHYYAAQTVKFLNGKARDFLIQENPELAEAGKGGAVAR